MLEGLWQASMCSSKGLSRYTKWIIASWTLKWLCLCKLYHNLWLDVLQCGCAAEKWTRCQLLSTMCLLLHSWTWAICYVRSSVFANLNQSRMPKTFIAAVTCATKITIIRFCRTGKLSTVNLNSEMHMMHTARWRYLTNTDFCLYVGSFVTCVQELRRQRNRCWVKIALHLPPPRT